MDKDTDRLVLFNARIYTMDKRQPVVSTLLIERGKITACGDSNALGAASGDASKYFDLAGKIIIPGLVDAHIHLQHYALSLQIVDCETKSREECLQNIAQKAAATAAGEWILGHGWNQNDWPEGFGKASHLDHSAPDNPVYLTAKSLHAAWVNSAALQKAGITAQTQDPPGGQIQRYSDGTPTGILFETAMTLVSDRLPKPSIQHVKQAIDQAQDNLLKFGITGAHDFDKRTCFAALQELQAGGRLKLRVIKSIPFESLDEAIKLGIRTGFGDDYLRIGSIKAFADGALGPRTAAMLQPYEGEQENRGLLMLDAEELVERGNLAVDNGLSLAVHAIGDAANHEVLRAFKQLRIRESERRTRNVDHHPSPQLRHRIEHVQVVHADDLPRLAEYEIIASMQPIHATSDYQAADRFWGTRSKFAYAWNSLIKLGTQMAFGSDAPVESPNPFWGLHAAVARRRADGSPGPDGWYPEQKISLLMALQGYTTGAAYAAGIENRLGKLAPGYHADLLVLDKDPFNTPPEELRDMLPLATMIAGEWLYQDPQFDPLTSSAGHPPF
jgi:predicted amidohydrolase YtcJ